MANSLAAWLTFDQLSYKFENIGGCDDPTPPIGEVRSQKIGGKVPFKNYVKPEVDGVWSVLLRILTKI